MGISDQKHWIVILIVMALVFDIKHLKDLGSGADEAIKGSRKAVNTEEDDKRDQSTAQPAQSLSQSYAIDARVQKAEEPVCKD